MKIKSLSHVGITVKDFEKSVRWYWDVFRLPLVSEGRMDAESLAGMRELYRLGDGISVRFGFLLCPRGGVVEIFEFSETQPWDHAWNRPGTTHFTMDIKGAAKWHAKLKSRDDVEMLCDVQNTDGNEWFFFRDPDGNLIEVIDLKMNYFALRRLGGLVGPLIRKSQFKKYYELKKIGSRG